MRQRPSLAPLAISLVMACAMVLGGCGRATEDDKGYAAKMAEAHKGDSPVPTAAGTTASNVSTTGNATTPDASIALNADATPVLATARRGSATPGIRPTR